MSDSGNLMDAAVLHAAKDLRFEQVEVPRPAEDEVLVRIATNGLCGSDIHFFEEGKLGPFRVTEPYIPGHEAVGEVVERGSALRAPEIGQRVTIEPGVPCRRCEHCKQGRYNLCENVVFMSAPPVNGTFAEYVTVAADFAHPVPEELDHEQAALIEPVSVGVQAANRARLTAGQSVAVLGVGPIGLITYLVARAYGATECYAVDVQHHRLALASELGVTGAIDAGEGDVAGEIAEWTRGRGVDVVFDTSGSSAACAVAPHLAKRGGVVTIVGWPEQASFAYPVETVIEKELDIRGVNRYCNTYPTAISLLSSGKLDMRPLISHRFPFSQVVEAFHFASTHRSETVKVMISRDY
jgi:L-iditol 2-dehydrogenase